MKRILTQLQLNQIVSILNEMPIKELNRVEAIIKIINDAEIVKEEEDDESNTED